MIMANVSLSFRCTVADLTEISVINSDNQAKIIDTNDIQRNKLYEIRTCPNALDVFIKPGFMFIFALILTLQTNKPPLLMV
jgi:hypothetical protein